jgi:hypothetical protein
VIRAAFLRPLWHRRLAWRVAICILVAYVGGPLQARPQSAPSLLAGKILWVRLYSKLSSKTAHVGDNVEAELVRPVKNHKQLVLPAGTHLRGVVEAVRVADKAHKIPPRLKISFTQMTLPDGRTVPTKASFGSSGMYPTSWSWAAFGVGITGAVVGGLIGLPWGASGVGWGAAVGSTAASLSWAYFSLARSRWRDVEVWNLALFLDDDLVLPPAPLAKH